MRLNLGPPKSLLMSVLFLACTVSTQLSGQADAASKNSDASSQQAVQAQALKLDPAKLVDLTHVLAAGIPDFHGDPSAFKYKSVFTIDKDGFAHGEYCAPEHLGTHMDAPCHFSKGGASIDQLPASQLIVPCVVIDVRKESAANADYMLSLDKVKSFEKDGLIPKGAAVFLLTGWSQKWSKPDDYRGVDAKGGMHFPGFSAAAADYLIDRGVVYLGIDTLSADPGNSTEYPVHHNSLAKGLHLIENLDALEKLPARGALVACAPLPIKGGTGSQVRVFAILP